MPYNGAAFAGRSFGGVEDVGAGALVVGSGGGSPYGGAIVGLVSAACGSGDVLVVIGAGSLFGFGCGEHALSVATTPNAIALRDTISNDEGTIPRARFI